jgi:rRNA processing protein Gar1
MQQVRWARAAAMAKNNKGMVCLLNAWEVEEARVNHAVPDCRNHRHLSKRRVCELSGDARFADRILAHVYDARQQLIGFIVEIAGRVRWCDKLGQRKCEVTRDAACIETINAHLNRFQDMIDVGQLPFEVVKLPNWRGNKPCIPPRDAVIVEVLRSFSPSSLTAKDSELGAEGAWRARRAHRNKER